MYKVSVILFILVTIISQHIAPATAACKDFHKYSCNDVSDEITQQLELEFNKNLLKYFKSKTLLDEIIRETLSLLSKCQHKQTFHDKIITFFESCASQNKNSFAYLNLLEEFVTKGFDYLSQLGKLQSYGFNNVLIKQTIKRNRNNLLHITLAPADLASISLLNNEKLKPLFEQIFDIKKVRENILYYRLSASMLRNIIKTYADFKDIKTVAFNDLATTYPDLKLKEYLQQLLGTKALNNISAITIENTRYFQYLNDKKCSDDLCKKLSFYLYINFLSYLEPNPMMEFNDMYCINDLRNKFEVGVNYIYHLRFFRWEANEYKIALEDMLSKLKTTILKHFEENPLKFSHKQLQYLRDKLNKITINIGHMYNIDNVAALQSYYDDLPEFDANNYYQNHLQLLEHTFRKSIQHQPNPDLFPNNFTITTPFYESQENKIVLPFCSLQLPLYHYRQSPLQQLSIFGFVLAHEITHAIDNNNLLEDDNEIALSIVNDMNFKNSLKCMSEQNYTEYLNERVADFFAIRVAYHTYKDFYAKGRTNWKQDFFMNFAKFFCGPSFPIHDALDKHDSDPIRLQQIVMNFEEFAEAFKCAINDDMHPPNKCRLY